MALMAIKAKSQYDSGGSFPGGDRSRWRLFGRQLL